MVDVENLLSAFSQEIRVRMVMLLSDSVLCVNCLTHALNLPQSTISRHLALLRRSGVAKVQRDNTHCFYTIDREEPMSDLKDGLIDTFDGSLKNMTPFKEDRERLEKVKRECNAGCLFCRNKKVD